MSNHPNRSGKGVSRNPKPKEIIAARLDAGLSQTAAAELVHTSCRAWQQWETEEGTEGHRRMHPAFWELFRIKVKELGE
jgi:DNA (cytosine-5)-methyltransferase 1